MAPPDPAEPKRRKSAAPPPAPPLLNYGRHVQHHPQFSARKGVVQCSGSKFKNRSKQTKSAQNRALNSKKGGARVAGVDLAPQWSAKVGLGRKQRNKCFYTVFGHGAPPKIVISALSCVFSAHSDSSELKKVTPAPLPMTGRGGAGVSEGPAPPMKCVPIDSARRVLSISIHFRSISINRQSRHHVRGAPRSCEPPAPRPAPRHVVLDVVLGSKIDLLKCFQTPVVLDRASNSESKNMWCHRQSSKKNFSRGGAASSTTPCTTPCTTPQHHPKIGPYRGRGG